MGPIQNTTSALPVFNTAPLAKANSVISTGSPTKAQPVSQNKPDSWFNNLTQSHEPKALLQSKISPIQENRSLNNISSPFTSSFNQPTPPIAAKNILPSSPNSPNNIGSSPANGSTPVNSLSSGVKTSASFSHNNPNGPPPPAPPSTAATSNINPNQVPPPPVGGPPRPYRGAPTRSQSLGADPFDATWAEPLARTGQTPTNPFVRQQTFQVSM